MKKKKYDLIFLAPYPSTKNIKDGAVQRIFNIDKVFSTKKRMYLSISLTKNRRKGIINHHSLIIEYKLNMLLHFFLIWKLLRTTKIIYIHSIYGFSHALFHLLFIKKQTIWLDVHGVVPEEEQLWHGQLKFFLYNCIEYIAFKKIKGAIYVTNTMQEHYRNKYNKTNLINVIYNIYPNGSHYEKENNDEIALKTVVIYSGNIQSWQNVDLMFQIIQNNLSEDIEYIILTGELEIMQLKAKEYGVENHVIIKTVSPQDLGEYYSKAHYGFILRDDILINRVANPTKMIEYLSYGIIPIVKLAEIGDFAKLDYEYIDYQNYTIYLKPKKSKKNIEIADKIINQKTDLKKYILQNHK